MSGNERRQVHLHVSGIRFLFVPAWKRRSEPLSISISTSSGQTFLIPGNFLFTLDFFLRSSTHKASLTPLGRWCFLFFSNIYAIRTCFVFGILATISWLYFSARTTYIRPHDLSRMGSSTSSEEAIGLPVPKQPWKQSLGKLTLGKW